MPNKKSRKSTSRRQPSAKVRTVFLNVGPYVKRILKHINTDTRRWKKGWTAQRIAEKYGLTKMQVAAVLANYNMGSYN